ncbi:Lipase (class 3) [Ceratobasidium sp. AG-Ba]|nr:Lipase (class 3) [Ceratobasidium sp. AG-Ba]
MAKLNCYQEIFRVSLTSNLIRDDKNTAPELQKLLAQKIPPVLADIGSGWSIAWQPTVWKKWAAYPFTPFGNAWYVAKHDDFEFEDGKKYRTYVTSIAGTASMNAVIEQDGDIGNCVYLDSWASKGLDGLQDAPTKHSTTEPTPDDPVFISNGFGQAVHRLITIPPFPDTPNLGKFLKREREQYPDAKFVFAGHSLGAALACGVSYTLVKADVLPSSNVLVYPTAGPSPGNKPFAESFKKLFPSPEGSLTGYKHWNVDVINPFDVVPCGYCTDTSYTSQTLDKVASMFGEPVVPQVGYIANLLIKLSKGAYYPITQSAIESSIPKPPSPPTSVDEFMAVGLPQHEKAYIDYILEHSSDSVSN